MRTCMQAVGEAGNARCGRPADFIETACWENLGITTREPYCAPCARTHLDNNIEHPWMQGYITGLRRIRRPDARVLP